jgi:hypothetical protein
MNTHADKTQENKSHSVSAANPQMQSGGESTFQFVDNRPEILQMRELQGMAYNRTDVVAQRKLKEMANNSPRVAQLKAFQDMANNGPQAKQTAQMPAMADNNIEQQHQPIQRKENDVIQRLQDKSGEEITIERIENENNLETLKEWAGLDSGWEDFEIMEAIETKIKTLEPVPLDVETPVVEDEQEVMAPVVKEKSKVVRKKDQKKAERKAKQAEKYAQNKPKQVQEKAERPALPAGTVYLDQLPAKGGTNKTRSWGKYPHVSVLLGTVNAKNNSVQLSDFHYSFGEKDTHFHWISKGGGSFEFVQDTSGFTQEGITRLHKAYTEVEKKAKKLGFVALKPGVLS